MNDIFISYAREDEQRIQPIVAALNRQGFSVFWDRHIPAGQTWRSYIGKALDDAACVLVAWSRNSVASNWVSEEAEDGLRRGILVPVSLDSVDPPLGFRSIQTADLSEWEPAVWSSNLEKLIADIASIVRKDHGPSASGKIPQPKILPVKDTALPLCSVFQRRWVYMVTAVSIAILAGGYAYWSATSTAGKFHAPALSRPSDGAQIVTQTAVNLEWEKPNTPDSLSFEIQLSKSEDFSGPIKTLHIRHYSYVSVNVPDLEFGRIFWRVRQHLSDGNSSPWSGTRRFTYYPSVFDRVLHTRRLRIGIESTRHEGIFASFKNKEFSGIDIELVRFIIASINGRYRYDIAKDPEIVQSPWGDPLFNLPNSGEADLIVSAITKTPEREQKYRLRFSKAYYTSLQTITVLSESGINTVQDLTGKRLGAEATTTNLQMAHAITGPDWVKVFKGTDTATQMFRALLDGEIDGVCLDIHLALTQLTQLGHKRQFRLFRLTPDKIPSTYKGPKTEEYAIAVKASEGDFLEVINQIIQDAKSSGLIDRLVARFMPQPLQLDMR